MLPGMVPQTRPCTMSRVWSTVGSMAILSHNSAAFVRGQPSAGPRSRERTVMPVAARPAFPGFRTASPLAFPQSCHSRSVLGLAKRAGQLFSHPEDVSATRPSLAPPSEPEDWVGGCDVTSPTSAGTSQSEAWRILQTGEAAAAAAAAAEAETQKVGEDPEKVEVTPRASWNGAARGS